MNKIKLLLVEDEEVLAMIVKETLELRGFLVTVARNGVEGWTYYSGLKPDVCVVDIMMPRKDGYSLVADIRRVDDFTPVVFLTAKTQAEDVIKGLELGADDYMKKPFSMEELVLRLKRLVRRSDQVAATAGTDGEEEIPIGGYLFDFRRLELKREGNSINLSQREAEVLRLLNQHRNDLLERKTALLKIWGEDTLFTARSMDVYITRLRKFFGGDTGIQILNVKGRGYKLLVDHVEK